MGLVNVLKELWNKRTSGAYIRWLRKQGVQIGENCIFRAPRTSRIDVSRPTLVTIGDNVDMNMNFQILTHDWASLVFRSKYHDFINSSSHVTLGSNIYIGTNVVILKGVTIGDNCIIGAGSVVTHDIPSDSVAVGSPCKVVYSLQDYYERRKREGLHDAVERVKSIQCRLGRNPYPNEMREEFIYFVNKENADYYEKLGVPIRYQLADAYDDWINTHHALFDNFDDFLKYVNSKVC